MLRITDYPALVLLTSFCFLMFSVWIGANVLRKVRDPSDAREDLGIVLPATLTLLGLIIGFSFSMAISRYDQRKTFEEEEANAIGTEYLRAGLLPAADAVRVRALLRDYFDQRVLFYTTRDGRQLRQIENAAVEKPVSPRKLLPIERFGQRRQPRRVFVNDVDMRHQSLRRAYQNNILARACRI